ncbi:hypothetical protein VE03_09418 [Pseudogymnoascus sp. 23342-1-I1]|nr:hypothetical protein VE03_09418 [Pseudogymnoascus sp. 23342-1-I1]
MSSEPLDVTLAASKLNLRRYEMYLETDEIKHKSNLCVYEAKYIQNKRILIDERKQERKEEKRRIEKEYWKNEKEKKKIEKENKKMEMKNKKMEMKREKENKKMEREREKEMEKTGGYKLRASFCWIF